LILSASIASLISINEGFGAEASGDVSAAMMARSWRVIHANGVGWGIVGFL
jgi:hypothetical protein